MSFKEKILGIVLILIAILPLLLKIKAIADSFAKYTFLSYLVPGEAVYQIILILIGILLVWSMKPKQRMPGYQ